MVKKLKSSRAGRPPLAGSAMRQIAIRLPITLIDELDAKVAALSADPLVRAERSILIRVLLLEAISTRKAKRKW